MSVIYKPKGRAAEYSYLAINHYRGGCGHGCTYCYARMQAIKYGTDFDNPQPITSLKFWPELERDAKKLQGTNQRCLLCFTCDPYHPIDCEHQHTREVLKILKKYDIPFQVLTKGGMRAARDFDLYGKYDVFATTMTFLSPDKSLKFEPKAALPKDRITAINLARVKGIETWVSLEPVLDANESLEIIRQTHEFVDLYKIGILNHISSDIDWRSFGITAIEFCEKYSVKYFIKEDLIKHLAGIKYSNTDTRLADKPVVKQKIEKQLF